VVDACEQLSVASGGTLRSLNTGGQTYSYARDRLGSVTGLVGTNTGQLDRSYTYTPYGYLHRQTGTVYNPFMFTGTYHDGGAYYLMGARTYHQSTGRFTQLDPLPKMLLTPNRYEYAGSNPCSFVDPTGLACDVPTTVYAGATAFFGLGAAIATVLLLPASVPFWVGALAVGSS